MTDQEITAKVHKVGLMSYLWVVTTRHGMEITGTAHTYHRAEELALAMVGALTVKEMPKQ